MLIKFKLQLSLIFRPHPAITATLLDFLCRIIHNFYPAEQDKVRAGIYSSLKTIVDKRVLPSLSPLFDNQRLDKELRAMLKERFGVFLTKDEDLDPSPVIDRDDTFGGIHEPGGAPAFSDDEEEENKDEVMEIGSQKSDTTATNNSLVTGKAAQSILDSAPSFGGSRTNDLSHLLESDNNGGPVGGNSYSKKLASKRNNSNHVTVNGEREELDQEIVVKLEDLRAETGAERRCEMMEQLVQLCIAEDVEGDAANKVAKELSEILKDQFEGKVFPDDPTPENIEDSIGQPLFVLFRTLCEINEIDPRR